MKTPSPYVRPCPVDPYHTTAFCDRFDAGYCMTCDKWLEDGCSIVGDPEQCPFHCWERPAKPSDALSR